MILGDIAKKARSLTHTDITSYPDAALLIDINIWYQKASTMILESADEADFDDARNTDYPILTQLLVAGQRDYPIPVANKVLKIKRLDIAYDGTNYVKAEPIDDGEMNFGMGSDSTTDKNFFRQVPRYDVKYNSFFLYPMPNSDDVASGATIRVEWDRQVTPFTVSDYTSVLTDSTVVPGFDDPFHPILAFGPAWEYAVAQQLPNSAAILQMLSDYESRMRIAYSRKVLDRRLKMSSFLDDNYGR
jgi:hypothetical protein